MSEIIQASYLVDDNGQMLELVDKTARDGLGNTVKIVEQTLTDAQKGRAKLNLSVYRNPNVRAVNHRGYSSAPENTLSAYQMSKKIGYEYVECDVSFTSDGVAVLLHDSTIDRTSNGTGNINEMTYAEVSQYDFGSWKDAAYTGEKIPTFEEFILLCKRLGLKPYIEIKTSPTPTDAQVLELVNIVKRYGMLDNSTWISFSPTPLEAVKANAPSARLGYVVSEILDSQLAWAVSAKTENNDVFMDASSTKLTTAMVEACVAENIPVEVWTINDAAALVALDAYVSGYTSDYLIADNVLLDAYLTQAEMPDTPEVPKATEELPAVFTTSFPVNSTFAYTETDSVTDTLYYGESSITGGKVTINWDHTQVTHIEFIPYVFKNGAPYKYLQGSELQTAGLGSYIQAAEYDFSEIWLNPGVGNGFIGAWHKQGENPGIQFNVPEGCTVGICIRTSNAILPTDTGIQKTDKTQSNYVSTWMKNGGLKVTVNEF